MAARIEKELGQPTRSQFASHNDLPRAGKMSDGSLEQGRVGRVLRHSVSVG